MNGIFCLITKSFSPIYNSIRSNKANIIPCRSSNLHFQFQSIPPLQANTRVLKYRVYSSSSSKDVMGSRDVVLIYRLISVGLIWLALLKAWEVFASSISISTGSEIKWVATGLIARCILKYLDDWLIDPPYKIGDMIEIGSMEGRVIKKLPIFAVLRGAENRMLIVPNYLFLRECTVFKTIGTCYDSMSFSIEIDEFDIDKFDKIEEISDEIVKMMKSNPNVLLKGRQPRWYQIRDSGVFCFHCHLKQMDPDIYFTARKDIQQQVVEIIKKHSATSVFDIFTANKDVISIRSSRST